MCTSDSASHPHEFRYFFASKFALSTFEGDRAFMTQIVVALHSWNRTDTAVAPTLQFGVQFDEVLVHREQLSASLQSEAQVNAVLASEATIAQAVRNDVAGVERSTGVRTDAAKLSAFTSQMVARARTATALSVAGAAEMNARLRTVAVNPPPLLVPPVEVRDFRRPAPLPLAHFGALSGARSWMMVRPADFDGGVFDAATPPPLAATTTAPRIGPPVFATGAGLGSVAPLPPLAAGSHNHGTVTASLW